MNEKLEREIIRYKVPFVRDEECLDEVTLNKIVYHFVEWQKAQILAEIKKMQDDERKWFMEACEQGEEPSSSGAVVLVKLELLEHNIKKMFDYSEMH